MSHLRRRPSARAAAWLGLSNPQKALFDLNVVVAIEPSADNWSELAVVALGLNQLEQAWSQIEQGLRLDPAHERLRHLRLLASMALDRDITKDAAQPTENEGRTLLLLVAARCFREHREHEAEEAVLAGLDDPQLNPRLRVGGQRRHASPPVR